MFAQPSSSLSSPFIKWESLTLTTAAKPQHREKEQPCVIYSHCRSTCVQRASLKKLPLALPDYSNSLNFCTFLISLINQDGVQHLWTCDLLNHLLLLWWSVSFRPTASKRGFKITFSCYFSCSFVEMPPCRSRNWAFWWFCSAKCLKWSQDCQDLRDNRILIFLGVVVLLEGEALPSSPNSLKAFYRFSSSHVLGVSVSASAKEKHCLSMMLPTPSEWGCASPMKPATRY